MSKFIPILMYHNIVTTIIPSAPDWVHVDSFKAQMNYLLKKRYTPISPELLLTQDALPKKPILITFDDGYENLYYLAFPILKELNINFTAFIISSFISSNTNKKENTWNTGWRPKAYHLSKDMINEMLDSKLLTIGSHSHSHQMFKDISEQEINEEIASSVKLLASEFEVTISTFSYPGGYVGNGTSTKSILKKEGIKLAFGGQSDRVEHLKKINFFNIHRINVTNELSFTSTKIKYRFDCLFHPILNRLSKYRKLNFILIKLFPPNDE